MPKQSDMDAMGVPHRVGGKDIILPPSMTPARQVGRSANDFTRIAEQQRRRGNWRPMYELGMQGQQFDRTKELRGMDQAFTEKRDAAQFDRTKELRGMDQAFTEKMQGESRDFQKQQTDQARNDAMEAEKRRNERSDFQWQRGRDAEMQDRQMSSMDKVFLQPDPTGQVMVPMVTDKGGVTRPMGGAYPVPKEKLMPTPEEINRRIAEDLAKGVITTWDGEKWSSTALRPQRTDPGGTTTTYDADGKVLQKQERRPATGGSGGGGSYW